MTTNFPFLYLITYHFPDGGQAQMFDAKRPELAAPIKVEADEKNGIPLCVYAVQRIEERGNELDVYLIIGPPHWQY